MPGSRRNSRHTVSFGRDEISFVLRRSDRKTLSISVNPDLSISVTAPRHASLDSIKRRIQIRAKWIKAQLTFFEGFIPPALPRRYVRGETHYYLGRQYRLKIVGSDREGVKLTHGIIEISQNGNRSRTRTKELLENWLTARARIRFEKSLNSCYQKLKGFDLPLPNLRLRQMKKRWGSCYAKTIYLNRDLIKAPSHCIDYVVMHELCHLKQRGHGKGFYALLSRVMPDWEQRKIRLERVSANFLPTL